MKIKPIYVTFKQAKLLKKKGFDEECLYHYKKDGTRHLFITDDEYESQAPEHWQVVEWLSVNHGIWISVKKNYDNGALLGFESIVDISDGFIDCGTFNTPQETYSAAFNYVLTNLI